MAAWENSLTGEPFAALEKVLPLLGGEGRGEGELEFQLSCFGLGSMGGTNWSVALPNLPRWSISRILILREGRDPSVIAIKPVLNHYEPSNQPSSLKINL